MRCLPRWSPASWKREAIQPHPLELVELAPPPKELAMLHFGDVYMMVRKQ